MRRAVVVDAVRTASGRGKAQGALSGVMPAQLLAQTLSQLLSRTGVDPARVDDVIAGCVNQVDDQAMNIARISWLAAGLPEAVPATTIDRQCGSSQQAVHFAAQGVMAGAYDIVIAGGVESMGRVPLGATVRGGDPERVLSARYPGGLVGQGISAELVMAKWHFDRETIDEYSATSHQRAAATAAAGGFKREIVPITLPDGSVHDTDETIRPQTTPEALAALPASFYSEEYSRRFPDLSWAITAGNSSPLTDGASACLIMAEETAQSLGLQPRAALHSFAVSGSDPVLMLTGVIPATHKVLERAGLTIDQIDAYEVNEAFAPVPLAWASEFGADPERLNPRGGAIALGHPLGSSGTRLLTTLINHLEDTEGRYGLQTMCERGGMANALIVERLR